MAIKELVDNACDAADAAGHPGEVTVEALSGSSYRITDQGAGITGTPEEIAALFSLDRPMISSKFWRLPLRGAMGNGIRCIAGSCAATDGTLQVTTRGQRILLKPTSRLTEILSVAPTPEDEISTEIVITFGPGMPSDIDGHGCELLWADATIRLAKVAGPAYARRPSPHWFDAAQLVETLFYIEPPDTTVRDFIAGLDGCSGARAGKLAAPFGKNRICQTMTAADAANLLAAAQADAREVKPKSLGAIGKWAFSGDEEGEGAEYDGYACREGVFSYGAHPPYARIPYLVETWAYVENRDGRKCHFDLMVNRTATTASFYAHRSLRGKTLTISGAELRLDIELKAGDCAILVHITSPFVPVRSIGKNPDLSGFWKAIGETVRLAFNQSHNLLPPDVRARKKTAEAKPEPKPKPEPHEPTTPLGIIIKREAAAAGIVKPRDVIRDLAVLSKDNDPYLLDTLKHHAAGQWFACQMERFVVPDKRIHLRGLHYAILSSGDVWMPGGKLYVNTNNCWLWLQRFAAKAARWLGYVEFNRIKDERNEPPRLICPGPAPTGGGKRSLTISRGEGFPEPPLLETMLPKLAWQSNVQGNQPYRLIFIAEKSSLKDVLEPLAYEFQADLLLGTGDLSDTYIAELAARAVDDGRPFVVLYFADFDPRMAHAEHRRPQVPGVD